MFLNYNNIIKNIINSINIIEIISSNIYLKKKGEYFFSICPFHKENNPSFFVNEIKKFYYCFGCKSYGNVINFLVNFKKITFIDAIKELSNILGIKLFLFNKNNLYNNKKYYYLYKNNNIICNLFKKNLLENIDNKYIKKYINEKKWSIDTINKFNIGYLSNCFIKKNYLFLKNIKFFLFKIGILYYKNNKIINKFNNRIIFPIYNEFGNIVAIGGRKILLNSNYSKYMNSNNSIIFKKRNTVYGLYQVIKEYNNNIPKLLIVEGYTDVISLNNFGIKYSVSILGSSITNEQILLLLKYTNEIIFCYDGDNVGNISSFITFKKILSYITDEKNIKFILLNNNEDPDSLIKKIGKIKFEKIVKKNSLDIFNFINVLFLKNYNKFSINKKIKTIKFIIKIINFIPSKLFRYFLKDKISKIINFNINYLFKNYKNINMIKNDIIFNNKNPIYIGTYIILNNLNFCKLVNIPKEIIMIDNFNIKIFFRIVFIFKKYNINNIESLLFFFKNKSYYYIINLLNLKKKINNINFNYLFFTKILNKIYFLVLYNYKKNYIKNKLIFKNK